MTHWTEQLYEEQAEMFAQMLDRRFDQATEDVERLLRLVENERGVEPERVLDVACGTGRHVAALAEAGCHSEGLDFSESFIDRARAHLTERGLDNRVDLHVHDMRDLADFDGSFDLITNFWNSLGYYDKATDVEILTEMCRLLSEDGLVTIEMTNKEHYIQNFDASSVREVDGTLHVERKEYDFKTGRFETTIDVFAIDDSGYEYLETLEFSPRIYAPVELREMFERAGFDEISLFGGFDGDDPSLDSPRVVVLAG